MILAGFAIVAIVTSLFLIVSSFVSIYKRPQWINDSVLHGKWSKIIILADVSSLILIYGTWIFYNSYIIQYRLVSVMAICSLSFLFFQSIFTDFTLRLVDRRITYLSILLSALFGIWFVVCFRDQRELILFGLFLLLSIAFLFFTGKSWGPADGQSMILVLLAGYPVLGPQGYFYGIIGISLCTLIYGTIVSIKKKTLKNISIPGVPLIILPFIVLLIINAFVPIA